jgi:hypothetical protein
MSPKPHLAYAAGFWWCVGPETMRAGYPMRDAFRRWYGVIRPPKESWDVPLSARPARPVRLTWA